MKTDVQHAAPAKAINADSLSAVSSSMRHACKCFYEVLNLIDELAGPVPTDGGSDAHVETSGRIQSLAAEAADLTDLANRVLREAERLRSLM